jgi:hypothetical protein
MRHQKKSQVEPAKVSAEFSSSTAGRRKFKEDWCKELTWLTFNRSTVIASCEIYISPFPVLQTQTER